MFIKPFFDITITLQCVLKKTKFHIKMTLQKQNFAIYSKSIQKRTEKSSYDINNHDKASRNIIYDFAGANSQYNFLFAQRRTSLHHMSNERIEIFKTILVKKSAKSLKFARERSDLELFEHLLQLSSWILRKTIKSRSSHSPVVILQSFS